MIPECQLMLAGRNAGKCWEHLLKQCPNVTLHPDVPDMRPLLDNASICLVPLRSGSGTRLKILEAMSSSRAVVSTPIGAEGITGIDGTHWLLAETADDFAARIIDLLLDPKLRHDLESSGRKLAIEHYSWQALTKGLVDKLIL